MPARWSMLTIGDVGRHVRERCLAPAGGPADVDAPEFADQETAVRRVGVEVEFLVHPTGNPAGDLPFDVLCAAVDDAGPRASRITYEPGGQLEISAPPRAGAAEACAVAAADLAVLEAALAGRGLTLAGLALDPVRPPRRVVGNPRYEAMERYFDAEGPAGRIMMCSTASVQVNLDLGPDAPFTWRLAHDLGPVLSAAFANSPGVRPDALGRHCRSTRLMNWWAIDPTRTRPAFAGADETPAAAWTRYALDARVMLVRHDDARFEPVLTPLTFARWIGAGHAGRFPTLDDFGYHLTTLFPPVRLRRWLELRMIDALPDPWWQVPVAVAGALVGDPDVAAEARQAAAPAADLWRQAAEAGPGHPVLRQAARACFAIALEALAGGPDAGLIPVVAAYQDRYVRQGRCPADDHLDAWARHGGALPALEAAAR